MAKTNHQWDDEVDVIVVGLGAAGACAALQAAQDGAEVAVVDRFEGGGATAISGGIFYAGGGTHIQEEAGVEDSVDAMFEYLKLEVRDAVEEKTLRDFCEQSIDNLTWLEAQGVEFEASLCPYKTSYPLDQYCLYYSGNESLQPYAQAAKPAQRGHRVKGKGMPGKRFFEPLKRAAHKLGMRFFYQSQAERLIADESGRVVGLEIRQLLPGALTTWLHRVLERAAIKINNYVPQLGKRLRGWLAAIESKHAKPRLIRARRGVVLSAGGFIYNRDMVKEYAPAYRPGMPLGTIGDSGAGIELGKRIGGATDRMGRVSAWRFINPPEAFTYGMLLNAKGERYVNEQLYGATIGEAMVEGNGGVGILVIDDELKKRARSQVGRGKTQWFQTAPALLNLWFNAKRGDTIEALARACKMPVDTLSKTIESYNATARDGGEDPFLKSPKGMKVLEPPYYAINCSVFSKRFLCPTLTLGGLVVDEETGGVKRDDGTVIEGLYAAGRTAVGVCSQQYVSGLSIADCVYSGRRAGRSLGLEEKPEQVSQQESKVA